jgi:hypothetical protein
MKNAAIALSLAALFASAAIPAQAQESSQLTSQLTRAQVIAEYQAAVASGNAPVSGEQYTGNNNAFGSTKTRAEVRAELLAAQQRGEVTSGEQYQNQVPGPAAAGKTRAQVRAELAAYREAYPALYNAPSL